MQQRAACRPRPPSVATGASRGREQHPVNCVSWDQAVAYCAWKGKRLPTEIEWEYAARGAMSHKFPWGDDNPATPGKPETDLCWKQAGTCIVAQYAGTALGAVAAVGLYDMAGNVYEWTSSHLCPYPLIAPGCDAGDGACSWPDPQTGVLMDRGRCRLNRGGAYNIMDPKYVHMAYRDPSPIGAQYPGLGFRCAR